MQCYYAEYTGALTQIYSSENGKYFKKNKRAGGGHKMPAVIWCQILGKVYCSMLLEFCKLHGIFCNIDKNIS